MKKMNVINTFHKDRKWSKMNTVQLSHTEGNDKTQQTVIELSHD